MAAAAWRPALFCHPPHPPDLGSGSNNHPCFGSTVHTAVTLWGSPGIPPESVPKVRLVNHLRFFHYSDSVWNVIVSGAFGPRGAVVECGVINPVCTQGHTPGF